MSKIFIIEGYTTNDWTTKPQPFRRFGTDKIDPPKGKETVNGYAAKDIGFFGVNQKELSEAIKTAKLFNGDCIISNYTTMIS